jgi:photosystem II stability/assembly factor-like uncharacterized protein
MKHTSMLHRGIAAGVLLLLLLLMSCRDRADQLPVPSWIPQQLNRNASIRGLSAVNEEVAWLSGSSNTIARTTNGGTDWMLLLPPSTDTLDFRDVEAFDSLRAVVMSAGPGDRSRVFRTEDGGCSWQETLRNEYPEGFFNGMAFWDENRGVLTGDPVDSTLFIMQTGDGGRTWQRVPPVRIPAADTAEYGFAASGSHIDAAGENLAWIGTGGSRARVFYTTDGGQQWSVAPTPIISGTPSTGIFSIAFLNEQQGIAVGGDYADPTLVKDNIATTTDGGRSWQLLRNHQIAYRSCVRKIDGWFLTCGPSGTDISYDLRQSWRRIDTVGYHVIAVGDSREAIWAAGAEGKVAKIEWE